MSAVSVGSRAERRPPWVWARARRLAAALARPAAADALVALAVAAVALAVRLPYVLAGDFPLNDGGLFWMMIEELRAAGYRLPDVTAYNAAGIPYVYPPFTFYLTGLLADLLRVDTLALLRILPLLASMATAPAFYRLARVMLPSRQTAVVAACAFALLPGAYVWAIMGGGLTRSFGFLFAVLALHQIHLMYTQQKVARALPVAALAALTVVSHLETAWFLAWSAAVLFAVHGRRRSGLLASALTAAGVVALTAPWWATVLARHGAGPLLAVMHTGDTAASGRFALALFRFDVTGEPLFPVLGVLALAGIGVCWRGRRLLLPYWLVALAMADNRAFQRHAAVPLALLIGVGAVTVAKALRPGGVRSPASQTAGASRGVMAATRVVAPAVALSLLLLYVAVSSVTAARGLAAALGPDDRSAMAWVAAETPADARFLVVSGIGWTGFGAYPTGMDADQAWGADRIAEWFPALAGRTSVATVQGAEWLPGFAAVEDRYYRAQYCAQRGVACLDQWLSATGASISHVYLPKAPAARATASGPDDCCAPLRAALAADPRYELQYDGPGASIFARR